MPADHDSLPPSFYFRLEFTGPGMACAPDNAFQEAAGLSVALNMEEVSAGGPNMYEPRFPTGAKYGNLVLKRGVVDKNAKLATWCMATTTTDFSRPIQLRDVLLHLLNANGEALATWTFQDAYPVKWSLSDLKAQESVLAIETLELAYSTFRRA